MERILVRRKSQALDRRTRATSCDQARDVDEPISAPPVTTARMLAALLFLIPKWRNVLSISATDNLSVWPS
jgi:hypothetical protein